MNINLVEVFILAIILFLVVDYKKDNNNLYIYILYICMVLFVLYACYFFDTIFFSPETWKYFFLMLIFSLFIIIIELIEEKTFDIYCLLIFVFLGSIILVLSDNLLMIYLGLELQTFSIFILVAKNRYSIKSSEAGLKYFILGALSSGFYLLGLTLFFLFGFSLNLKDLILLNSESLTNFALFFISLSLCFKLGMFPLHFWIPDVYEGSSWDIVSVLSSIPKISVLCIIVQILVNSNLILSFAILSIIVGTLGSLNQTKIKRLLGYSGISHIGFILIGYTFLNTNGFSASTLYLTIYMVSMISLFILIINFNLNISYIIELSSIKFINKLLVISYILLILSIAGIPPLSGFISKWYLLWVSIDFHYNITSFIIILFSAIGAGYYLRLIKILYFQKKSSFFLWKAILCQNNKPLSLSLLYLGFFIFFVIFSILNYSFLIDLINISSVNLF